LLRGTTVVAVTRVSSAFWSRPTVTLTDTTAPTRTTQSYRIEVSDGNHAVRGGYSTVTVR
jgi:hypothetical protein